MKAFLRDNPTIAFGLGLPLLLVITFLLISGIPTLLVAPPKHDVLYATDYYNYPNGIQITVVDQKVRVVHQGNVQRNRKPRLWRYNPQTGAVKEIGIILPNGLVTATQSNANTKETIITTVVNVPELKELVVDSSSIAPDGYEFSLGKDRSSGGVFGGLFYSSRYRNAGVLTKNWRSIRLPHASGRYYSGNTHFIGWVVSL